VQSTFHNVWTEVRKQEGLTLNQEISTVSQKRPTFDLLQY